VSRGAELQQSMASTVAPSSFRDDLWKFLRYEKAGWNRGMGYQHIDVVNPIISFINHA
jgi:hypothetical protein